MSRPLDALTIPARGVHLIEASAGTGKTYTITSLFLRLIGEEGLPLEGIAAVTFTNAATAELKERVQKRLAKVVSELARGEPDPSDAVSVHLSTLPSRTLVLRRLEAALRVVDRVAIFTIHGFAARMLSQHAFESGVRTDLELLPDDRAIVYDVVTDFWTSQVASLPEEQFAELGVEGDHRTLTDVARTLAGAFEVPLAGDPSPSLDLGQCLARFRDVFQAVREDFRQGGAELAELLLTSPALNRSKYPLARLQKDAAALGEYFSEETPSARAYPDLERGRWSTAQVRAGIKKGKQAPVHPLLDQLGELKLAADDVIEAARQLGSHLRARLAKEIERRLTREHELGRTQSFDGLLSTLLTALRKAQAGLRLARSIRARYPAILIDEFQDTDKIQYEIFQRISAVETDRAVLYLIGDPKQSIYRFRGADIQTYLQAAKDAAGSTWTLDVSWRSSPDLVASLNDLFGKGRRPFAVPGIEYTSVRAAPHAKNRLRSQGTAAPAMRIVVCHSRDPYEQAAAEVASLLSSGLEIDARPLLPSQIAVLTRTNKQAETVQRYLRELGIPAVMHGDRSVFEAPEALELRRILRALAEPGQRALARAALSTRFLGVTSSELFRMREDVELLELWSGRLRAFGDLWRGRGVAEALEALADSIDLLPRTLRETDGERRMTNYRHLLELLHEAERREHLGIVGLLRWFDTAIAAPTGHAMASESRQVRLESDEEAVTLTTAHKSKGLEYDLVVLPSIGATERNFPSAAVRFHDPEEHDQEKLEVRARGSSEDVDAHFEQARLEELQEALRVGYVALTRAKHQVTCIYQAPKGTSPLGWFLHEHQLQGETLVALASGLRALPQDEKLTDLARLSSQSEGRIALLSEDDLPRLAELPLQDRTPFRGYSLVPPQPRPDVPRPLYSSSFSAMTRGSEGLSRQAREGRDVDEVIEDGPSVSEPSESALSFEPGEARTAGHPPPDQEGLSSTILLSDFPRGAGPGNALHAIFEHLPLQGSSPVERRAVVARWLAQFGYLEPHEEAVASSVERALHLPLLPSAARLIDLSPQDMVREMEFSLSVGSEETGSTGQLLSGGALGRALGAAKEPYLSAGYLKRVRDLGFGAFRGYLRGFIDLVFVVGGRFYVLDYKSNFLGERYVDYLGPKLQRSMEEHHYLLQGLLYAVAVERYARTRLPSYEHQAHFGGVIYLFLRGVMQPGLETNDGAVPGIYFFRPERRVMDAISAVLSGEK